MLKIAILIVSTLTIIFIKTTPSSAFHVPSEVEHEGLTEEDLKELELLEQHFSRPKRSGSGSGDILNTLKTAVVAGISKKLGQLAKGSAGASAGFSKGSSSGGKTYEHDYHGYDHHAPHESYDHKDYNFWELKKSILNTLLQAVKAIKGGVVAIKGQLIKGSGYIVSGSGKQISAKGEAVTKLGKNIIHSAVLVPFKGHQPSGHTEYGSPSSHYNAPSGPAEVYHDAPSGFGPEYSHSGPGSHYTEHSGHDDHKLPHGAQAGILLLKKIPKSNGDHAEESKIPPFKTIPASSPSFGTIFGKFFSASTSLNPHKPEPFGHTASADVFPSYGAHDSHHEPHHHEPHYHESHHESHHHEPHHHESHHHESHHEPPPHHYEEPRHNVIKPASHKEHYHHSSSSEVDIKPAISSSFVVEGKPLAPLPTNYGVPFEQSNFADQSSSDHFFGEASQNKPQYLAQNGIKLTEGEKAALSKPPSISNEGSTSSKSQTNGDSVALLNNISDQLHKDLPKPTSTNSFFRQPYRAQVQPSAVSISNSQSNVVKSPTSDSVALLNGLSNDFYQLPTTNTNNFFRQPNLGPVQSNGFQDFPDQFYQDIPKPGTAVFSPQVKHNFAKPFNGGAVNSSRNKPISFINEFSKDFQKSRPRPISSNSFVMNNNDQDLLSIGTIPGIANFANFGSEPLSEFPLLPTPLPQGISSLLKTPDLEPNVQVMHVYDRDRPTKQNKKPSTYRVSNGSNNKHRQPSLNVVKSIAYELTPDGPKRLSKRT